MLNKPLLIAAIAATVSTATISTPASASDPVLGALIGAGIGAAIGHNIHGRDGAWVGGALGAVAGASIAASSRGYYDGYYDGPSAVYSEPAPVYYGAPYYQPAPVYYAPAVRVYSGHPAYVQSYQPRYAPYGRDSHGQRDWRDNGGYRQRDGLQRSGY